MKKKGRRPKLTRELIYYVSETTKEGHFTKDVCKACMISTKSYYQWKKEAEVILQKLENEELKEEELSERESLLIEFLQSVKKAEAHSKIQALKNIRKAGQEDWRAEAWFLERKHSTQFGAVKNIVIQENSEEEKPKIFEWLQE